MPVKRLRKMIVALTAISVRSGSSAEALCSAGAVAFCSITNDEAAYKYLYLFRENTIRAS